MTNRALITLFSLAACGTDIRPGGVVDELAPDGGALPDPMRADAGVGGEPAELSPDAAVPAVDAGVPVTRPQLAVIVGYGGRRARSLDGRTWTNFVQIDPNGTDDDNLLRGVTYGQGMFIAVGGSTNSFVTRSSDGINWTAPQRTLGDWLGGAAFVGTTLVAAGGNGLRARSTDRGSTWQVAGSYQAIHYRDVASNGSIAVAVGHTYNLSPNVGVIVTTTDGITWTERVKSGQQLNRVVAGNGVFVAAGNAGGIMRSTNGTTWSPVSLANSGGVHVTFTGSVFLARVGTTSYRSVDGATWTTVNISRPIEAVINGRFLSTRWPAEISASTDLNYWLGVFSPGGSGFTRIAIGEAP